MRAKLRTLVLPLVRVGIPAAMIVIVAVHAAIGADSGVVGSNGARPLMFVIQLASNVELCQGLGTAKRRPISAQMTLGTEAAGAQPLRVRIKGEPSAKVLREYRDGVVAIPLPADAAVSGDVLCLKNLGSSRVSLAGETGGGAAVNGVAKPFSVSLLLLAERRRWSDGALEMLERVGFARNGMGGTFIPVAIGLMLLLSSTCALLATWRLVR